MVFFWVLVFNQEIFFQMGSQSGVSNHCIWGLNNYIQCDNVRHVGSLPSKVRVKHLVKGSSVILCKISLIFDGDTLI